jgi:putative FmdB family regulatory protein
VLERFLRRLADLPLYEYECPKDGTFERVRKFSDPPLTACPTCGGPIEKLASAPAIQFKGTGWYVTDYARKSGGGGSDKGSAKDGSKDSSKDNGPSSSSEAKSTSSESKGSASSPAKDSGTAKK